jgi:hypothetical protein
MYSNTDTRQAINAILGKTLNAIGDISGRIGPNTKVIPS